MKTRFSSKKVLFTRNISTYRMGKRSYFPASGHHISRKSVVVIVRAIGLLGDCHGASTFVKYKNSTNTTLEAKSKQLAGLAEPSACCRSTQFLARSGVVPARKECEWAAFEFIWSSRCGYEMFEFRWSCPRPLKTNHTSEIENKSHPYNKSYLSITNKQVWVMHSDPWQWLPHSSTLQKWRKHNVTARQHITTMWILQVPKWTVFSTIWWSCTIERTGGFSNETRFERNNVGIFTSKWWVL